MPPRGHGKKTSPQIIAKVKEVVSSDARFTVRQIARTVGISKGSVHTILEHI